MDKVPVFTGDLQDVPWCTWRHPYGCMSLPISLSSIPLFFRRNLTFWGSDHVGFALNVAGDLFFCLFLGGIKNFY